MKNPLQQILQQQGLSATYYKPGSRYESIPVGEYENEDQETIQYVKRRFIPPPKAYEVIQEHTVVQGERLDHIAFKYLGMLSSFGVSAMPMLSWIRMS
jgi:hypothetical protein